MRAPVPGNILKRCNGVPEEGEEKNLLIRKATAEEMLRLWGYRDAGAAPPTARYFYRHISSGNAVFWTVEDGEELVGELYAFLDIEEDRDFADGKTAAYLCAFRIRKDHRGRGIGTGLMETALADLKERGFRRATIGVSGSGTKECTDAWGSSRRSRTAIPTRAREMRICSRNRTKVTRCCQRNFDPVDPGNGKG